MTPYEKYWNRFNALELSDLIEFEFRKLPEGYPKVISSSAICPDLMIEVSNGKRFSIVIREIEQTSPA